MKQHEEQLTNVVIDVERNRKARSFNFLRIEELERELAKLQESLSIAEAESHAPNNSDTGSKRLGILSAVGNTPTVELTTLS